MLLLLLPLLALQGVDDDDDDEEAAAAAAAAAEIIEEEGCGELMTLIGEGVTAVGVSFVAGFPPEMAGAPANGLPALPRKDELGLFFISSFSFFRASSLSWATRTTMGAPEEEETVTMVAGAPCAGVSPVAFGTIIVGQEMYC